MLNESGNSPQERILATGDDIAEIAEFQFAPTEIRVDMLIGTAKLMIRRYIETSPDVDDESNRLMNSLAATDSSMLYEGLDLIRKLEERMKGKAISGTAPQTHVPSLVYYLLKIIWDYTSLNFYQLEVIKKRAEQSKGVSKSTSA